MVIVMPKKVFVKEIKKLARFKDYIIVDMTDSNSGSITTKYTNAISLDQMCPPAKVVKYLDRENSHDFEEYDEKKIKKELKRWLKGTNLAHGICAIVDTMLKADKDLNIFLIMRPKDYRVLGSTLVDRFHDILDTDVMFAYTWEEGGCKAILDKELSKKSCQELQDCLDDLKAELAAMNENTKKKKKPLEDDDDEYSGRRRKKNKSSAYSKYFKSALKGKYANFDEVDYLLK